MRTIAGWVQKFNDECTAHKKLPLLEDFKTTEEFESNLKFITSCNNQKSKTSWKESDFELDINEKIDQEYCHLDWHYWALCQTCESNIGNFNETNTSEGIENMLINRIAKLEAFIHTRFPEFDISDTD
jgi:hypothetical protein